MVDFLLLLGFQILIVHFVFPRLGGIKTSSDWMDSLIVVVIFAILNFALRKLLLVVTLGMAGLFYYLTLGIAGLVLNALILLFISNLYPEKIKMNGFVSAFMGGFFLALASFVLGK
jgi:putative membrane protein